MSPGRLAKLYSSGPVVKKEPVLGALPSGVSCRGLLGM